MPTTYIAVHGVGRPVPGQIASQVSSMLGLGFARRADFSSDGHGYVRLVQELGPEAGSRDTDSSDRDTPASSSRRSVGDSVIEVNWSDVMRPRATALSLLRFLVYITTSMVDLAVEKANGSWIARTYRAALFTAVPGAVLLILLGVLQVAPDDTWESIVASVLVLLAALAAGISSQKLGSYFRWFWPWVGLGTLVTALGPFLRARPIQWVTLPSWALEVGVLLLVVVTLLFAACHISVRFAHSGRDRWTAHLALLWVPFLVVNIAATWAGFLGMVAVHSYWPEGFGRWAEHVDPGPFLAYVEGATTLVVGGLPILAILFVALGYWSGRRKTDSRHSDIENNARGRGARAGAALFFAVAPLTLVGLLGYIAWAAWHFHGLDYSYDSSRIFEVYRTSILRTLPYLGLLLRPFTIAADVIADVVFFLHPDDKHPASNRKACRLRLAAALEYAARSDDKVVVLAHSQGSVIAVDLLTDPESNRFLQTLKRLEGRLHLLTVGSPISSLYRRFLGKKYEPPSGVRWSNAYRQGDYIGGPIDLEPVDNSSRGPGGHTDYWTDPEVSSWIALNRSPNRPSSSRDATGRSSSPRTGEPPNTSPRR